MWDGMNAQAGKEEVGDGSSGETTAVNQLQGNGLRVRKRVQLMFVKERGIPEAVRGPGIDQSADGYRWVMRDEKVYSQGKMTGLGKG